MYLRLIVILLLTPTLFSGCDRLSSTPSTLSFRVITTRPHDPTAYTQGLQLHENRLFESTGLYGRSSVREIDRATGIVTQKLDLPTTVFGEGLTFHGDQLFVLTWREQIAYVINPTSFSIERTLSYNGEGWGMTSDGEHLIVSDGTSTLKIIDPTTFLVIRRLPVTERGQPVINLNELEFVNGHIYANVYMTDRIIEINASNGNVIASLDLSTLRQHLPQPNNAEVLNGIAYDPATGNLLVTGKNWPVLFEIVVSKTK